MSQHIEAAWQSYRKGVVPPDAPQIQVTECRRAFYGGADALFNKIFVLLTPESEPTTADLAMICALQLEFMDYAEAVKTGRA